MLLAEGIVTENVLGRKKFFFVAVYRPHHMSADDFEMFIQRIELLADYMCDEKPHCIIFAGDFNSRCKQWWPEDDEDHQGIALDEFIESNALFQLIDQPTHILENSKSCIDLIITNQPSLFAESGVHPSLFRGCHHEIIFGKVAVSVPHPPPYKRRMWDYKVADVLPIHESLMNIDWDLEFGDLEPNVMADKFTEIILSIIAENGLNRVITVNERDPPWITKEIKTAIRCKHCIYNKYIKRGSKQEDWEQVRIVRNQTTHLIDDAKKNYFKSLGKNLTDPNTGIKAYWQSIKKCLNKKKFTNIPPLLENDIFVTNVQTKTTIFNDFLVKQCSLLENDAVLPALFPRTSLILENIEVSPRKILESIRSLDSNKAHGCDDVSISMLKICDEAVVLPLIDTNCLEKGVYPNLWKKAKVLPIHRKESLQLTKNYRPISLLPICGKLFEKIIFCEIYTHLQENNLLSPKQSGFQMGDFTQNQLLSITNEIPVAFDQYPTLETRAVFLDVI